MPFPTSEILRERAPVPGAEPMPGIAVPQEPGREVAPPSMETGLAEMRRGGGMQQAALMQGATRQAEIDQQLREQAEQNAAANAPLQERLGVLAQEPQPGVAAPPVLPEPPSLAVRPFLTGTPGEPPEQSLQRAVMGLSLLAQMGFGAASGVPELSLRALAGAMEGWQAGDIVRGDREFGEWQATVGTMQKDYANRRQLVEDIVNRNKGDVERTRIALLTQLAQQGASRQELEALTKSNDAYFSLLAQQGGIVKDLGEAEAELDMKIKAREMDNAMKAAMLRGQIAKMEQDARQHTDTMQWRAGEEDRKSRLSAQQAEQQSALQAQRDEAAERRARIAAGNNARTVPDEKRKSAVAVIDTFLSQYEALLPKLESAGFLPGDSGVKEHARAAAKRGGGPVPIPGYSEPNHPDWRAWLDLQGNLVGFARTVQNEIGPRAMAAFEQAFRTSNQPPTKKGLEEILKNMRDQLKASETGVNPLAGAPAADAEPGAPAETSGGWGKARIKP